MAVTPNYNMVLPDVGGSVDEWGGDLNDDLGTIDTQMKANEDAGDTNAADIATLDTEMTATEIVADGALQRTGQDTYPEGLMEGRVDVYTSTTRYHDFGVESGTVVMDALIANYFAMSLDGAVALEWDNMYGVGEHASIYIIEIEPNGNTIDWSALGNMLWAYGVEPTPSADGIDVYTLITRDNGASWTAALAQADCKL